MRLMMLLGVCAPLVFSFPGSAGQLPAPTAEPAALRTYDLPDTVSFPEGVAYDAEAGVLYTGSATNGVLIRIDAATHAVEEVASAGTLVPADLDTFPGVLGMEVDKVKRLWVAGGRTGMIWVLDTGTGTVIRRLTVPTAGKSLINDVALIGSAAYFTDTSVPTLWRIQAGSGAVGEVEPWLDFTGTAVEYAQGSNLNGITATPDGGSLIVVQMTKGLLFRIDVASRAVTTIDTAGEDLSGADGLVLDGDLLYVVRQRAGEIAAVRMNADLTKGTVISRFTDPALTWPATAVKVGADLVVVNTQFNTRSSNTPRRPFKLLRVPASRIASPGKSR